MQKNVKYGLAIVLIVVIIAAAVVVYYQYGVAPAGHRYGDFPTITGGDISAVEGLEPYLVDRAVVPEGENPPIWATEDLLLTEAQKEQGKCTYTFSGGPSCLFEQGA